MRSWYGTRGWVSENFSATAAGIRQWQISFTFIRRGWQGDDIRFLMSEVEVTQDKGTARLSLHYLYLHVYFFIFVFK